MDKKLLLVKAATLLYRESQLSNQSDNSADVVKKIIEDIKLPTLQLGVMDTDREMLGGLKDMAMEMSNNPASHQYEPIELLQKVKFFASEQSSVYTAFKEGVEVELSQRALKRFCLNLRQDLTNHFNELKVSDIVNKAAYKLKFERETVGDLKKFVSDVYGSLEPYQMAGGQVDPAIVASVDMNDPEGVAAVFELSDTLNNNEGIMRTGWQGLNRMLQGGFRRGEMVAVGALQHNFKTGFSLSIFEHVALYNKPFMLDETKKPLLLRISFEDPLTLNMPFLYRNIYENETGEKAVLKGRKTSEMAAYVMEKLKVNGFEIMMLQVNPTLWTYKNIQNKILELEAEGYEIHMLELDYLAMVPTTGCTEGPAGDAMRDMYRRIRNFTAPKRITLITPHQLSSEAKMLMRQSGENFVQEIANKGYYDGCKRIDQEVDLEIYIHIVKVNGKSWLTIQRGKHRLVNITPDEYKYCVLPFEDIGDIRVDINGDDTTRKKPGGGPIGSKEENPFWVFGK
jgi:hypothetical protein